MKRKEFLKKIGIASGCFFAAAGAGFADQNDKQQEKKDHKQEFKEEWIKSLLNNMENQLDENSRIKLMQSCGRNCARRGAVKLAESCRGNVKKLVDKLAEMLGKDNYMEGSSVYVSYPKCMCELVDDGPDKLSDTYCFCSTGWLHEMFETAAQKPVKVEILQTVKRGASSCKFIVSV